MSIPANTRVYATITRIVPKHVNKRTGQLRPERTSISIIEATVISVSVSNEYLVKDIKNNKTYACFGHEITPVDVNPLAL
jgi:hypothetical protein